LSLPFWKVIKYNLLLIQSLEGLQKLHNFAQLLIYDTEIDIDALLEKDLLTLDEAMKTANDAVLLAIKAVSVLKSVSLVF